MRTGATQTPPGAAPVRVEAAATAPARWDAYVAAHPQASAYHLAAAVAIGRDAFGLRTTYLSAVDAQSRIVGVLPLVEQSSLAFGRFLVSVPFFTYGGVLADDDAIAVQLATRAAELAQARGAKHAELRHMGPIEGLPFAARLDKVSMMLELPSTFDALAKQVGAKLRSQVKRAERENPEVVWGGTELLGDFYRVFSSTMHELGTPVYSRRFFELALKAFGDLARVLVVRAGGEVQAVSIVVRHGDRLEVPWAAATPAAKRNAMNMRLYWEMLRFAVESQAARFDFGRSSLDSGTYKFKAQWGAQPVQLHWHYWLPAGAAVPQLNHSNPKYELATTLWKRMPLWCANLLGPLIARNLP